MMRPIGAAARQKHGQLGIKRDHAGWQAYTNGPRLLAALMFRAI